MVGISFSVLLISQPLHQVLSANLGGRMAAHLYDRLDLDLRRTAGDRPPRTCRADDRPDDGSRLRPRHDGPAAARSRWTSSPAAWSTSSSASARRSCWPPSIGGRRCCWSCAWLSTHWLLRESGVWRDRNTDEVRKAQRHAEYSYRLAVDAAPAKELRFFGLAGWVTDRFVSTRRTPLRPAVRGDPAAREVGHVVPRDRPRRQRRRVLVDRRWRRRPAASPSARVVVFVQAAIGVSSIAFGGLNWAIDGAAAPVAALLRLEAAVGAGALPDRHGRADAGPARRSASATCRSPTRTAAEPCSTASI